MNRDEVVEDSVDHSQSSDKDDLPSMDLNEPNEVLSHEDKEDNHTLSEDTHKLASLTGYGL